jgi:uncharacterized protein (DUF1778 family)
MQLDEQIQQHVVVLPISLKSEVLDFVLFLEQKLANKDFTDTERGFIRPNKEQQQFFVERLLNPTAGSDKLKRSAQAYQRADGIINACK